MEHIIDFEIYTRGNSKTLILIDASETYEYPANQIVEVTFPNKETIYRYYYNVDKPTVLTTKQLGYSPNKIDFPDGLYTIRVSVTPNEKVFKCKKYMKTDLLEGKIADLLEGCVENSEVKNIMDFDKYITASKMIADSNPDKSIELFNLVNKKVNKKNCYV